MALKSLKLPARLATGFGLVLALMVVMVAIGAWRLSQLRSLADDVHDRTVRLELVERWRGSTALNLSRTNMLLLSGNLEALVGPTRKQMAATTEFISGIQKALDALEMPADEKKLLEEIADERKRYIALRNESFEKLKAGGDAVALQATLGASADTYLASIIKLQDHIKEDIDLESRQLDQLADSGRTLLILLCLLGLAAGVAAAVTITRSVTRPVRRAIGVAEAIAGGDLTRQIDTAGDDEVAELMRKLDTMQQALRRMVTDIRSTTDSISTASAQIASGNQDLSGRTEQTAGSLQQTASSMEQLTGTVRQTADSARTANQLAASAAEAAQRGGSVVQQVVANMEDINTSSRKIADIIGTIDGIAFQTNILALNAAVEAARAGEQGRGFAVVAGEVRSLAQRSATAAREIKSLIGASVEKVESGSRLVQDAGTTMTEIVSGVQRVTDIIGEITAAASEQSNELGQVNGAVVQLDQMTQQNAALVEESAAAAESLREQAQRLAEVVSIFRVSDMDMARVSAPTPRPRSVTPLKTVSRPAPAPRPAAVKPPAPAVTRRPAAPALAAASTAPSPAPAPRGGGGDGDWESF